VHVKSDGISNMTQHRRCEYRPAPREAWAPKPMGNGRVREGLANHPQCEEYSLVGPESAFDVGEEVIGVLDSR
jgi:hypothetical protein